MTNKGIIGLGHVVALVAIVTGGLIVAAQDDTHGNPQDSNNSNSKSSKSNSNSSRSKNANDSSMTASSSMNASGMTGLSSGDRKFVMEAAMGGMSEVQMGQRASQQGQSESVKQFGQRMVDDHSKANAELTTLVSGKGITLPTDLDAKHKDKMAKMAKMSPADFDRAYAKDMLSDHNKDVALFKKEAESGTDPDIKAFAAKTLPTLQEHLQMAQSLNGTTNGGSKNSNTNSGSGNVKGNGNSNHR